MLRVGLNVSQHNSIYNTKERFSTLEFSHVKFKYYLLTSSQDLATHLNKPQN